MEVDLLVFSAHPDDAEIGCGGTIAKYITSGKKAAVIDLTGGELGTRGSVKLRAEEAAKASKIFGLSARENLGLPDGFFENNKESKLSVIRMIRKYRPKIILANPLEDRHPDHGRAGILVSEAAFLSGLSKIETSDSDGKAQEPWRAPVLLHYMLSRFFKPNIIVPLIQEDMDKKIEAIKAFSSQFYNPDSKEPETHISRPDFMDGIIGRASELGKHINAKFGEAFTIQKFLGVNNIFDLC